MLPARTKRQACINTVVIILHGVLLWCKFLQISVDREEIKYGQEEQRNHHGTVG